jgi:OmcA/MtrC family decaheme c-type cytochrome
MADSVIENQRRAVAPHRPWFAACTAQQAIVRRCEMSRPTCEKFAAACCVALLAVGCGKKGDPGANGAAGTSCAVTDNHDGTATIKCTDGTSVNVANGTNGSAGSSCKVHDNGNGTATITCTDGTSATVANGANGVSCIVTNNGNGSRTITCGNGTSVTVADLTVDYNVMTPDEIKVAALSAVVTGITIPADGKPVVNLKVSERHGYGVRGLALPVPGSSTALAVSWRFALLKLVPGSAPVGAPALGVNGSANDTWVSYLAANATATAGAESAAAAATASAGLVTDGADGTYTYKFAKVITGGAAAAGTVYDANAVHRLVVIISQTGIPFAPINLVKDFVPATGADVTGQNEKVDPAACLECHTSFKSLPDSTGTLGSGEFHGGTRYDVRACVACHNDQRRFQTFAAPAPNVEVNDSAIAADGTWVGNLAKVNGEAVINLPVWIHKIHMGERLSLQGGSYAGLLALNADTYPQDIRNCQKCHRNPAGNPAPQADNWKARPSRRACNACHDAVSFTSPPPLGRVLHTGGAVADDTNCTLCHKSDDTDLAGKPQHLAVLPPDPNATWFTGGTNSNTNAAYIAATGVVPPGANVVSYVINSVGVDANGHPQIVFKFQMDGADVVFTTQPASATPAQELIPGGNFVGSPSAYFAWAVPQDGIAAPEPVALLLLMLRR